MYHYVYKITNTEEDKHYIGARTSKVHPIDDLGISYFSSSHDNHFINDQKANPQKYQYIILDIVSSRKEAISLEIELHDKFDVGVNESFYNRAKQTSVGWDTTGIERSAEARLKQSASTRGRQRPIEWRQRISESLRGKSHSEEFKEKCRQNNLGEKNPNFGKSHSAERKMKIAESLKNNERVICPHCGKDGAKSPMQRWHFDNCRNLSNIRL
mgnify:CR=1 FL=1